MDDTKSTLSVFKDEERERRLSMLSNHPLQMSRQVSSIPEEHIFD